MKYSSAAEEREEALIPFVITKAVTLVLASTHVNLEAHVPHTDQGNTLVKEAKK